MCVQFMFTAMKEDNKLSFSKPAVYISNRRLLLSLADAGGRLMYAYKDLLELAGLTTRLYTLLSTLHSLPPLPSGGMGANTLGEAFELQHVDVCVPDAGDREDGGTAAATMLVRDLSLVVKEGEHLLITGSNGVGKTAIARVLAGLWAAHGSHAKVWRPMDADANGIGPRRMSVFVVPQRAYMVAGSLLDQLIYPHSYADFVETRTTEAELLEILEMASLKHLLDREGGWLTRKEWRDVLSGGEKQRVSHIFFSFVNFVSNSRRWLWPVSFTTVQSLQFLTVRADTYSS